MRLAVVLGLFASAALADPAAARVERVRWRYEAPERVAGFKIHVGTESGSYGVVFDAGKPTPDGRVYSYEFELADDAIAFVAISAYTASGEQSALSNEVKHKPDGGGGGGGGGDGGEKPEDDDPDKLVERFGSYEVGEDPTGWMDTGPGATRGADASLFAVARLKGNRTFMTESELSDIHSHYLTAESPTWTHYEFRGRMRVEDPDGGVGVTVLSQFPGRDAYYRLRRSASASDGEFAMAPRPEGYAIRCETASSGVAAVKKRWFRFRVQVAAEEGETRIRAKVWRARREEPRRWQIECVDDSPTRLVKGAPGVWSSGPGAKHWDDLKVIPLEPGVIKGDAPRRSNPKRAPATPVLVD